jgi:acyl carrier protein
MGLDRSALVEFIQSNFGLDGTALDTDTVLFSSNLLDSLSMVELMVFIEREAGIKIRATEVSLDNLDSITRILSFVERKRG